MAQESIVIGGGGEAYATPEELLLKYGNRHGLIAGATGTGKTITMQIMAEEFSRAGVPVFLTDIKGDVGGMAVAGTPRDSFQRRADTIGLGTLSYAAMPVTFWDLFGQNGHPVRTTMADMGPLLLSRILELTDAQEGVINVAFRMADEEGWPLLDLPDLRAMLQFLADNRQDVSAKYGNVTTASIGAIQRRLLVLENQGAASFFGEPALDIHDLMQVTAQGQGHVNILHAERLMTTPRLYATFMLWLLSELFEELPEVGDSDQPKLVFFFDEAHLLFTGAPRALIEKVEQVARLIRSKGVGVYFITQNPDDVPDTILSQLGNRVQHALRAFTARDQQALRRAAQTYRTNPRFDTEVAIREVGVGEAMTSFLEAKGIPGMVERTLIRPPASAMGPCDDAVRRQIIAASPMGRKYDTMIDRDSAQEMLARRAEAAARQAEGFDARGKDDETEERYSRARRYQPPGSIRNRRGDDDDKPRSTSRSSGRSSSRSSRSDSVVEAFTKSMARSIGTRAGTAIVRGVLGGLFRGR
ncbi:helicase HerA-like domain-containing protein [Pararhodobacter zhoushanensis]|uniref:helicase HerA-like domain-containing protein n=1 Tax=Pararhodobacter zhoushanensis TaxID=2479545 RepID=UPI000F8D9AA4|nr:helicase HerA-like domain-containing protein [Pararhodobacter zhoushanensis]